MFDATLFRRFLRRKTVILNLKPDGERAVRGVLMAQSRSQVVLAQATYYEQGHAGAPVDGVTIVERVTILFTQADPSPVLPATEGGE